MKESEALAALVGIFVGICLGPVFVFLYYRLSEWRARRRFEKSRGEW